MYATLNVGGRIIECALRSKLMGSSVLTRLHQLDEESMDSTQDGFWNAVDYINRTIFDDISTNEPMK